MSEQLIDERQSASGSPAKAARRGAGGLSSTLRRKIFLAFLAMAAITGLLGYQGVRWIGESGRLVARTYDEPLMAINYARAALANFNALEAVAARSALEADPVARERLSQRSEEILLDLYDDLDIVAGRSATARAEGAAAEVRRAVARWDAVRRDAGAGLDAWPLLDQAADAAREQLDILVNLAAGDGFIGRQRALRVIEQNRRFYMAATVVALIVAAAIAFLLVRMILRPVRAASDVAARIARGELDTPIPTASRDELGALLASMEVMRDSIRSMMADEVARRRHAQGRLVDAIENSRDGVVLVDASGAVVVANSQVTKFAPMIEGRVAEGASFEALVATAIEQGVFAAGTAAAVTQRLLVDPLPSVCELEIAGGRWLRISRSRTAEGGMIAMIGDISSLKERESELRAAKERAEAGSRSKTQFLTNMSHELRTPLNAVIGFSEMMSMEAFGPLAPKYKEYADDILGSGRHLLSVINDVLDVARSESGKLQVEPVPLDVASLFAACRKMVYDQCTRASLHFEVVAPEPPLRVMADPVRARQILLNLIANAVKFTPASGRIAVGAAQDEPGFVRIAVSDTGIGMAPEEIPLALEAFSQVDSRLARKYEGTGLGLPLTKALVELHGGRLEIRSRPGEGTTVEVVLPAADPALSAAA
ncbi:signal transduction histidine kinase [Constrictibacter sp. MBR-5]|jgi:signal transduction histidine kinase|uniref:sensor histidine kinase n=1 Tax=Constrictibacter sp. MBR-5 TaxID=3156467 RepID=UPI0033985665